MDSTTALMTSQNDKELVHPYCCILTMDSTTALMTSQNDKKLVHPYCCILTMNSVTALMTSQNDKELARFFTPAVHRVDAILNSVEKRTIWH
jgi:hypothetical protein